MRVHIGDPAAAAQDLRDPDQLLGEGGEAKVFSCTFKGQPAAAKILKCDIAPRLPKIRAMVQMAPKFPSQVLVPQSLIYDDKGKPIGTVTMLAEGEDLVQLCQIDFKENNGLNNDFTNSYFRQMHTVLGNVHQAGAIVGDLNYNNWRFKTTDDAYVAVLDADSMIIPGFPGAPTHPLFFDPLFSELLQQYIAGANKMGYQMRLSHTPQFGPNSDWYSYTVALCWALMCIHPFHGSLAGFNDEFKRMEGRKSIFSTGVKIPKIVMQPDQLSDELAHYFIKVFEKNERGVFPLHLLTKWHTCASCGLPFNKRYCPVCQLGIAPPVAMVQNQTCTMRVVKSMNGRRLLAHSYQDKLRFVYEENGELKNQDGVGIISLTSTPDTRVAISLDKVYIGVGDQVFETWPGISQPQITIRQTARMGRLPVFAANSAGLYHIMGSWLMGPDGRKIGGVVNGKCWFSVGETLGFGFNKIGNGYYYFLFRVGQAGFFDLPDLPNPKGKMIDWTVYYAKDCLLYTMASEYNGQRYHESFLVRSDGVIIAAMEDDPRNVRLLGNITGKMIWNKNMLLTSTDDGVLTFAPESGTKPTIFGERKLFGDTSKFVKGGDEIYLTSDGKMVYVIRPREVISLTV